MLIRAGYDLMFEAYAPAPMISMLSVRPDRCEALQTPHRLVSDRAIGMEDYLDVFGNICTRMTLPTGYMSMACDFVVEDPGTVDPQSPEAIPPTS